MSCEKNFWQEYCIVFPFKIKNTIKVVSTVISCGISIQWKKFQQFSPVLALSIYILINPGTLSDHFKEDGSFSKGTTVLLFTVKNQYSQFMNIFWKMMIQNQEDFKNLGLDVGDLVSHSSKKWYSSLTVVGFIVSYTIKHIFFCDFCSLVTVKEQYTHYEKVEYQFLSSMVSGLNVLST